MKLIKLEDDINMVYETGKCIPVRNVWMMGDYCCPLSAIFRFAVKGVTTKSMHGDRGVSILRFAMNSYDVPIELLDGLATAWDGHPLEQGQGEMYVTGYRLGERLAKRWQAHAS